MSLVLNNARLKQAEVANQQPIAGRWQQKNQTAAAKDPEE